MRPKDDHRFTLVFLHGLGDNAINFTRYSFSSGLKLPPGFKLVCPQAPKFTHPLNEVLNSWNDWKKWPQPDWPEIVTNDWLDETFHQKSISASA